MNDKRIKEAMRYYIEKRVDTVLSESEETQSPASLDEKVYAMIGKSPSRDRHKTVMMRLWGKICAVAAAFVVVVGLGVTTVRVFHKEPAHIKQDECYSITVSYGDKQYGYHSNRLVIDKFGLSEIPDLKSTPDLFTGTLSAEDIIQIDSAFDKNRFIGAKIYPYSDDVLILQCNGQFFYFEKAEIN